MIWFILASIVLLYNGIKFHYTGSLWNGGYMLAYSIAIMLHYGFYGSVY